ncbi:phenylalanine--tRNA ligase subunit beta-related protein, partial [Pseudomonas syringae group genomosp. 7]|uniref:phenylalanine--tRNA ligase subunit beta-related protein n=1 Tax=Pseudomonas syringae group genomosp. 7 TaxID=251699 RepID=UPI00376F6B8D
NDVNQCKGNDPHRISLAVGDTWQHPSRTLKDEEVNASTLAILTSLAERLNASLRK